MTKVAKALLPRRIRNWMKNRNHAGYLRESTRFHDLGAPGPAVDLFARLKHIPGWFNVDDCCHFLMLLKHQTLLGLRGDILEIGSYHGRSTALLASSLKSGERLVVCDAFQSETEDRYSERPSPDLLRKNVAQVVPGFDLESLEVHACLSNDLSLEQDRLFRFIHIDGGHSFEQAGFDLMLCSSHTMPGGIIVMDDYGHPDWPGVTRASDEFIAERSDFEILADLNRHGALGRKLYLLKVPD